MANPDKNDMKITIDGKEVEVKPGSFLIDAAKKLDIDIPTYCYHELLPSRPASCRMCLVEIKGSAKLQASCATPVMDGMVIDTNSEAVLKARASQNEFMLSNHALDCPVCDKGGECELQDSVVAHGPHEGKHAEQKHRFHDRDYELSPVIVKDSNRCVQCMRCTRVCTEVVGAEAIGTIGRGHLQEETSFFKTEMDCDQCGMCIEVCPTGCFMRAPYRYSSRPWDNESASVVCTSCGTGCRMTLEQRDGTVMRSLGKLDEGFNSLLLCAAGRFGYDVANSEDRVIHPLVKKNGKFEPVSWAEALKVVKEKLNGNKVGGIISPKLSNEDHYLFKKLFKNVFKSNNIDSDSRWNSNAVADFISATGIDSTTSDINECLTANTMLVVGGHISDENPVTEYMVRTTTFARPMSLVIASPRGMKLDQNANLSIRNIPGSEGALLSGVEKLLGGGSADSEAKTVGVDVDKIQGIADRFKRSEIVSLLVGTDLIRYGSGAKELATLVEKLKSDGKTVFVHPLLDRGNQRGAWDMGVLPNDGMGADAMIEAASKGELDTLHIVGEDVINMFPDRKMAVDALDKIKFLVVQDSFMTDTALMADVVLPSATTSEREGTFTNQEGRVQKADVLMAPKGDSLPDYEIIASIGQEIDSSFGPYYAYEIFSDIIGEVGSYSEIKEADFEENTKGVFTKLTGSLAGSSSKVSGGSGFKSAAGGGDFTLITGNHLNLSGTETSKSDILSGLVKEAFVELSVSDASSMGISEGDTVKISSNGTEAELTAKVNGILKGNVFVSENFNDAPVNKFFTKGEILPKVSISKSK